MTQNPADQIKQDNPRPYANKGDLATGCIRGHLTRLTIPMIWGFLAVIGVQLADTFFIGMLGTQELAAIGFTFPVTMGVSHFLIGMNIAMASVVSRLIGEKKTDEMSRLIFHGIVIAVIFASIVCLAGYTLIDPVFTTLGAQDNALLLIREYMPLWFLGFVILTVPMTGNSAIRAAGDTKIPAIVMVSAALLNFALDPILIFGLFGAPALGIKGAALATLIAYILAMVMGLYFLIVKKRLLDLSGLSFDQFPNSLRRMMIIALPAGLTNIIQPATNAFIVSLLAVHGAQTVAGFGIASRVEGFAMLIVLSLAIGMAPVVGQNWGAQLYERVYESIDKSIRFNMLWSLAVAAILGVLAYPIAGAFSGDTGVTEYTVLFFWIVPLSYAFATLIITWSSAFNAMGLPQYSLAMIAGTYLCLMMPAVYIGSTLYGVTGIFAAMAIVHVIAGSTAHMVSRRLCLAQEDRRRRQQSA